MPHRKILVLVGPTASGKTAVSLHLARALGGEIISADSRQCYRLLDIGTAKPSMEERDGIPHHFLDFLPPDAPYNAGLFGTQGRVVIDEIFTRGRLPIVVGGSGLYVRSLIDGLFDGPGADPEFREFLEQRLREEGIASLQKDLEKVDPDSARNIDPTKPRRIIRALEVFHLTGIPLSEHHKIVSEISFASIQIGMLWERADLYARINRRCEQMIERGLLQEVDKLTEMGYDRKLQALNTVGYAEGFAFRAGEITREEMVVRFKQNSRRYAKRQMTWFRADPRVRWMPVQASDSPESVAIRIVAGLSDSPPQSPSLHSPSPLRGAEGERGKCEKE